MKKILWISLILLSLLAVLVACAHDGGETLPPMGQGNTEPPTPADPPDPFSEEEYKAWALGVALNEDDYYEAADAHEVDGRVYQRVTSQTSFPPVFDFQAIYRYDHFFTYSSENEAVNPVWFRGKTSLFIFDNAGTDLPLPSDSLLVNIQDPAVFGLLEEYVLSQSFAKEGTRPEWNHHYVMFIVRDLSGKETTYTIYREGTVIRNDTEFASCKLEETVTAALFALKYAYARSASKQEVYADEVFDFSSEFAESGLIQITVTQDGENRRLNSAESREFLRLVSDPTPDGMTDIAYNCFLRSNCGMGERGEKLLDFTLLHVYEDGAEEPMWTYSLYEDGKVVYKDNYYMEYQGNHISTLDHLFIDRYIISRSNFDTQAVLDFLNS